MIQYTGEKVITTTGNIDNLDFSNAAVLYLNNASLATIRGLKAGSGGQRLRIVSVGAGQVNLAHLNANSSAANQMTNVVTSGITPLAAGKGAATYEYDLANTKWRLIEHEQGAPISVAYTSTDYTADAGTWTVDSGDLGTYTYTIRGKRLLIDFTATTTSISSASATRMQVLIPNGYTYTREARQGAVIFNGGTSTEGMARSVATETRMFLYRDPGASAYATATNTSNFFTSFEAEID